MEKQTRISNEQQETEIPQHYKDLVGTRRQFSGGLFSRKAMVEPTEYDVLDIRWGEATVINFKQGYDESDYEYPTFELLLKNDTMKKSRWTRPFPIREINLRKPQPTTTVR